VATDDPDRISRMLATAQKFVRQGLQADDSVFTPGRAIWTSQHAEELLQHYVGNLDAGVGTFFDKLAEQLAGASDGAVQLMAELFYLNMLPLADYTPTKKRSNVEQVLAMMASPVQLSPDLVDALGSGSFSGGVAFKTQRWAQLVFLVEFVVWWKGLDDARRESLLQDPYAFRDAVLAIRSQRAPSQRMSLVYLVFPEDFEPIVSGDHKRWIQTTFAGEIGGATSDVDRDLAAIRRVLTARTDAHFDFYLSPWREQWKQVRASTTPGPSRRAWFVRSGEGDDVVARWVLEGSVSRPAAHLEALDASADESTIRAAVEEGYGGLSSHARTAKAEEIETFLHRMRKGDLVLAVVEDQAYLGAVSGDPAVVVERGDGALLRRGVEWRQDSFPIADLPSTLAARLGARGILEITEHLEALDALLAGEVGPRAPELILEPASAELAEQVLMPRDWLQECVQLLGEQRQLILHGPPGTGKTYVALALAHHLADRARTTLVQFHPAYSYEDFFEGYRPAGTQDGTVCFTLTPGPFRRLVDQARENPGEAHVLVIDEINRGNLAKIFGELYFLLEYRGEAIDLLYGGSEGQAFTMPPNVFVIGTMNTADRSIALVDAAMRRRFAFVGMHPSSEPTKGLLRRWLIQQGLPTVTADLHDRLNELITDADMKIGPSYFMRTTVAQDAVLDRVWRTSILPLLEEHHYGDGIDVAERYDLASLRRSVEPA
jgi:5-methylcytosine-specific restriction enzyme B